MLIATRCPHCETLFHLHQAQVMMRSGLVRCGMCQQVFNAPYHLVIRCITKTTDDATDNSADNFADNSLVTQDEALQADMAPASQQPAPPVEMTPSLQPFSDFSQSTAELDAGKWTQAGTQAGEQAAAIKQTVKHAPTPPLSAPVPSAAPSALSVEPSQLQTPKETHSSVPANTLLKQADASPFGALDADNTQQPFTIVRKQRQPEPPAKTIRHFKNEFIAIALTVLLIVQIGWWQRETVMMYWPKSQPIFKRLCTKLGCAISPPREIEGLQIEASSLRQINSPYRLELNVPIYNRYNVALAYPTLELTLFDQKNEVAIRRVLSPKDYVYPGTRITTGVPARSTQKIALRLDTGRVIATNFHIQIFYP